MELFDAKILKEGTHGNLYSVPLEKTHVDPSSLRPGEEASVYKRTLTRIKLRAKDDPVLSLHRFKVWWLRPVFRRPIPPESVFVLETVDNEDESYRLLLPVLLPQLESGSFASASLRGNLLQEEESEQREQLILCGNHDVAGLYVGVSKDPYALIEEGVALAKSMWQSSTKASAAAVTGLASPTKKHNNVALGKLGWCTWNAFYTALNGLKVVDAVRSLQEHYGIPVRWMILDDGWQHTTERGRSPGMTNTELGSSSAVTETDSALDGDQWTQRLQSYREDPKKFKEQDLKETVRQLHEELGLESVWVWHTLAGYWMGLNTESESFLGKASSLQYPHFSPGILDNDPSASAETSVEEGIGVAADAEDFFHRYHAEYLSKICGVDGIKVDAQGVIGALQPTKWNDIKHSNESTVVDDNCRVEAPVLRLHNALAESAQKNFSTAQYPKHGSKNNQSPCIIHCMAHAPEIYYRLPALYEKGHDNSSQQLPLLRAADDFYPDNDDSHGPQIVACAYNSLIFQHVAIPDWDMFATSTKVSPAILQCHAVARCLSGGPIYFSSAPSDLLHGHERPLWIDWICCENGTTLPCRGTALPVSSSLLRDPLASGAKPLVLWNTNGDGPTLTSGVFGAFHLAGSGTWDYERLNYISTKENGRQEEPSSVEVRPCDIPFFKGRKRTYFLAVSFFAQTVTELESPKIPTTLMLDHLGSEVVSIYPLEHHLERSGGSTLDMIPLGLEGKINGAGAVLDIQTSGSSADLRVRGCGNLLVAVRDGKTSSAPTGTGYELPIAGISISVEVNGRPIETFYDAPATDAQQETDTPGTSSALRTHLFEIGFGVLTINIPDSVASTEEGMHVKLDFLN